MRRKVSSQELLFALILRRRVERGIQLLVLRLVVPSVQSILHKFCKCDALHLVNLSKDYLVGKLSILFYSLDPKVIKSAEKKCLPPHIFKHLVLLQILVIKHKDIEVSDLVVIKYRLCHRPVRVSQIVNVHIIVLSTPHIIFPRVTQHVVILDLGLHELHLPKSEDAIALLVLIVEVDELEHRVVLDLPLEMLGEQAAS